MSVTEKKRQGEEGLLAKDDAQTERDDKKNLKIAKEEVAMIFCGFYCYQRPFSSVMTFTTLYYDTQRMASKNHVRDVMVRDMNNHEKETGEKLMKKAKQDNDSGIAYCRWQLQ